MTTKATSPIGSVDVDHPHTDTTHAPPEVKESDLTITPPGKLQDHEGNAPVEAEADEPVRTGRGTVHFAQDVDSVSWVGRL
jgi:hypothetical protein